MCQQPKSSTADFSPDTTKKKKTSTFQHHTRIHKIIDMYKKKYMFNGIKEEKKINEKILNNIHEKIYPNSTIPPKKFHLSKIND